MKQKKPISDAAVRGHAESVLDIGVEQPKLIGMKLLRRRFFRWLLGLTGALLAVGLLLLVLLAWHLNPILLKALNERLPAFLGVTVQVEDFQLSLLRGQLLIKGVSIGQPQGFSDKDPLFAFGEFAAQIHMRSLLDREVVIEMLELHRPMATIHVNRDGVMNMEVVSRSFHSQAVAEKTVEETTDTDPASSPGFAVWVKRIRIHDLSLHYRNAADPEENIALRIDNLAFGIDDIRMSWIPVEGGYLPSVHMDRIFLRDALIVLRRYTASGEPMDEKMLETHLLSEIEAEKDEKQEVPKEEVEKLVSPVRIERITLDGMRLVLHEQRLSEVPLDLSVYDMAAALGNLLIDPSVLVNHDENATLSASFRIQQKGEVESSRFGMEGRFSPLRKGAPDINAFVRLIGFELETIRPLLAPKASAILGGRGLDVAVNLAMSETLLDARVELLGSKGVLTELSVGGTPAAPQLDDLMRLVFGIASRPLVFLQGTGVNLFGTGRKLIGGVADTATAAVKGTARTVGGFARGLTDTGRGLVHGNLEGVTGGLRQATIGTISEAGSTVSGTGGSALAGVMAATSTATGGERREIWLKTFDKRYEVAMIQAHEWLEKRPFPPQRLDRRGVSAKKETKR